MPDPRCTCRRLTAPIGGTTESAFRYVVSADCPVHVEGDFPRGWRRLRDGKRLDPTERIVDA